MQSGKEGLLGSLWLPAPQATPQATTAKQKINHTSPTALVCRLAICNVVSTTLYIPSPYIDLLGPIGFLKFSSNPTSTYAQVCQSPCAPPCNMQSDERPELMHCNVPGTASMPVSRGCGISLHVFLVSRLHIGLPSSLWLQQTNTFGMLLLTYCFAESR